MKIVVIPYCNANKNAYNRLAQEYNERCGKNLEHQEAVLSPFEEKLKQDFEFPIKILDIGCGVGLDSLILTKHGFQVQGIDISEDMIEYSIQNVRRG
ncbi:MAG: class I SAM-dependent methyltransferase, partial [Nanoarchaeota archaeon]